MAGAQVSTLLQTIISLLERRVEIKTVSSSTEIYFLKQSLKN